MKVITLSLAEMRALATAIWPDVTFPHLQDGYVPPTWPISRESLDVMAPSGDDVVLRFEYEYGGTR